jgi:hypothetical protein
VGSTFSLRLFSSLSTGLLIWPYQESWIHRNLSFFTYGLYDIIQKAFMCLVLHLSWVTVQIICNCLVKEGHAAKFQNCPVFTSDNCYPYFCFWGLSLLLLYIRGGYLKWVCCGASREHLVVVFGWPHYLHWPLVMSFLLGLFMVQIFCHLLCVVSHCTSSY